MVVRASEVFYNVNRSGKTAVGPKGTEISQKLSKDERIQNLLKAMEKGKTYSYLQLLGRLDKKVWKMGTLRVFCSLLVNQGKLERVQKRSKNDRHNESYFKRIK